MLNEITKGNLFCNYYLQWIKVYKEGAIRDVTLDKYYIEDKELFTLFYGKDVTKEEAIKYLDGIECGNYAKEKGVTVIVLPSGFDEELARLMEADLGVMSQRIGGYHLIYCNYVLQFEGK